jgi:hypothetical protein
MKARKDSAKPIHAAVKDVLSRLLEARGYSVEQEAEFPWDHGKRILRIDVLARPPRRSKPLAIFGFEIQSDNLPKKRLEVSEALKGGVVGIQDVVVVDISSWSFDEPQRLWHQRLEEEMACLEELGT